MTPLVGVFVGGRSTRMGGSPKGLLAAPDTGESLVSRAVRVARELPAEVVLVGEASAYAASTPDVLAIADDPPGIGPLGGLHALFCAAQGRPVVAIACDMPYVSRPSLRALLDAPSAACAAARNAERTRWEPFFARYDAALARPVAAAMIERGERALQRLVEALAPVEVAVDPSAVIDWDTPEDVALRRCRTP